MASSCASPGLDITATIFYILLITVMIVLTALFVYAYVAQQLKCSISLFIAGLAFFITILSHTVLNMMAWLVYCDERPQSQYLHSLLQSIGALILTLRCLLFLGILLYRLYLTFQNSALSLSRCTLRSFFIYFGFTALLLLAAMINSFLSNLPGGDGGFSLAVSTLLSSLSFFNVLLLNVFLVSLFIFKLVQVFKSVEVHGQSFIALITKTSLLYFTATVLYFVYMIGIMVVYQTEIRQAGVLLVVKALDISHLGITFLAIFMTYRRFDAYYMRMCGCLDGSCRRCCMTCIAGKKGQTAGSNVLAMARMDSVQSSPSTENTLETAP